MMNSFLLTSITPVAGPAPTHLAALRAVKEALPGDGAGNDFGSVLGQFVGNAAATVRAGEAAALKGLAGGASTQEVVEAVMAAEQALQATVAIRDKIVSAYLEISRMAI
jgi:flagellar hook-basal body complex protein FliE